MTSDCEVYAVAETEKLPVQLYSFLNTGEPRSFTERIFRVTGNQGERRHCREIIKEAVENTGFVFLARSGGTILKSVSVNQKGSEVNRIFGPLEVQHGGEVAFALRAGMIQSRS